MERLEAGNFVLRIESSKGKFHLGSKTKPWFCLTDLKILIKYEKEQEVFLFPQSEWEINQIIDGNLAVQGVGKVPGKTIITYPDKNGIIYKIDFAIILGSDLCIWKLSCENHSSEKITMHWVDMFAGEISKDLFFSGDYEQKDKPELAFFSNGWQSWSRTAVYGVDEKVPYTSLSFIPNADSTNPGTPKAKGFGHFTSDFFGVFGDRKSRRAVLAGFLSQQQQFGYFELDQGRFSKLRLRAVCDQVELQPDGELETDWAVIAPIDIDDPDALGEYLDAVADYHGINVRKEIPAGWCSWYEFFTKVKAENIAENLEIIKEMHSQLPLDLVQLDDGYQTEGGDWFDCNDNFLEGLVPLVEDTKAHGLTPGLWIAPLIANVKARLVKEHPEYFLRNRIGAFVNAGFISEKFARALDVSNPYALEYVKSVIKNAVDDWGYPYLKLDFLYAGALSGKHFDRSLTRAQILRRCFQAIRDSAGTETFILGCGSPLASSLGLFDGMRIGADVDGFWKPKLFGVPKLFDNDPQLPSARNAIQNVLTRAALHDRWWINDPDCLLVRADTELSLEEVRSLATLIGITGGAVLLSDDLPKLSKERLKIAQSLFPIIGKRPWVLDWFDRQTSRYLRLEMENTSGKWQVLAYFNWGDESENISLTRQDFRLKDGSYWTSDFWNEKTLLVGKDQSLWQGDVSSHSVILISVREVEKGKVQYVGSNLHFSQGFEITEMEDGTEKTTLSINAGRTILGEVKVFIPNEIDEVLCNGNKISFEKLGDGVIGLALPECSQAEIEIFK